MPDPTLTWTETTGTWHSGCGRYLILRGVLPGGTEVFNLRGLDHGCGPGGYFITERYSLGEARRAAASHAYSAEHGAERDIPDDFPATAMTRFFWPISEGTTRAALAVVRDGGRLVARVVGMSRGEDAYQPGVYAEIDLTPVDSTAQTGEARTYIPGPRCRSALPAVAGALTGDETAEFLRRAALSWPKTDGADVADVLDETVEHDLFLPVTGPFCERNEQLRGNPGVIYALHALIILERPVTVMNVLDLLLRAGLIPEKPLDWEDSISGWLAHGRENDYLVSDDTYGQVRLTRWVRYPGEIEEGHPVARFAAEVLANSVPVPSEEYGRDMAQAHEEGRPSAGVRAWQGARQYRKPLNRQTHL